MGKWNNRRSRRFFYHQYRDPASSYYDSNKPPPPLPDFAEDGIPLWEKKFCSLIGSVPWQKIVNVKEYIFCHDTVANWDDSAGKDAFQSAKRHFWEEINGIPSEHSLPDADMYIDEVNWNPNIDPELIKDLERSLFVPEEGEDCHELECKSKNENKNTIKSVSAPSEEWNRNPGEIRTPTECDNNVPNSVALENKSQGWNQWPNSTYNSRNNDNPWECCFHLGNEAVKGNTWGDCSTRIKLQEWNKSRENVNQLTDWNNCAVNNDDNPWEQSFSQKNQSGEDNTWNGVDQKYWQAGGNQWKRSNWGSDPRKERAWGNLDHSYWGKDQHEIGRMNNGGNQSERNFKQSRGNLNDGQWRGSGRNESSWRRSEDQYRESKESGSRQAGRSWGMWTGSHRKREGNHQYATHNKHSRFGESNYQTGRQWR